MIAEVIEQDGKHRLKFDKASAYEFDRRLKKLSGCKVSVTVKRYKKNRTSQQNKYLWGVVYRVIEDHTGNDSESLHHYFKSEFLSEFAGAVPKVKSTSKLNTTEFMDYVEKIARWAAEFDGIYIPMPNEVDYE